MSLSKHIVNELQGLYFKTFGPLPDELRITNNRSKYGQRRRLSKNKKHSIDRLHKHAPLGYWPCGHRDNPAAGKKQRR